MKKRGFTLIELLAVIVILAIIALIAIPQITNVIEEARKGAAESSALGYIDAVEKYIMLHDVDSTKYPYDLRGKTLNVAKNTEISLLDIFIKRVYAESAIPSLNEIINPKGKKPTSGTIVVNEKGKVSNYAIIINKYKVKPKKDGNDNLVVDKPVARKMGAIIVSYHANGGTGEMADTKDIVVANAFTAPEDMLFKEWNTKSDGTGEVYTSESLLEDDIDLYAIWKEDSRPKKIVASSTDTHKGIVYMDPTDLLKKCTKTDVDANVNSNGTPTGIKTGCMKFYIYDDSGDNYKMILDHNTTPRINRLSAPTALAATLQNWKITPRLITTSEINTIVNHTGFDVSGNSQYYLPSGYGWLYDNLSGCKEYGCPSEDNYTNYPFYDNASDKSYTFEYWTNDIKGGSYTWALSYKGFLDWCSGSPASFGIRPVIEVPKSSING